MMFGQKLIFSLAAVSIASVIAALPAQAYFSTIDTGEVIKPGTYQASFAPQLIFNKYEGINAVGRLDAGINEASSVRGILGFGKVDFQVGAMYKFIPFPDTPRQPAIGGEAGVILARVSGETEFSVRFHPLVSKKFEAEIGDLIPYASLPLGFTSRPNETFVPIQLVGGTELRPLNMPNFSFFAELGINLNKSFSYLTGAVAYRFDDFRFGRK